MFDFNANDRMLTLVEDLAITAARAREYVELRKILDVVVHKLKNEEIKEQLSITITFKTKPFVPLEDMLKDADIRINEAVKEVKSIKLD